MRETLGWAGSTSMGGPSVQFRSGCQEASHCFSPLANRARKWHNSSAPSSPRRIPSPFIRLPMTFLQADSTGPEPIAHPVAWYVGSYSRCTGFSKDPITSPCSFRTASRPSRGARTAPPASPRPPRVSAGGTTARATPRASIHRRGRAPGPGRPGVPRHSRT